MMTETESLATAYENRVKLFKLLSHPARLAILDILRDGEHCVCHMEAHLGLRQAYLSQQLAVLREAGLILDRREGWNIFYRVADPRIYAMLDSLLAITGQEPAPSAREVDCPCPHCTATRGG